MKLQPETKSLWLFLHSSGGYYTANELAELHDWSVHFAMTKLQSMVRTNLVKKIAAAEGSRRRRYGITGECMVPQGVTLGEAQI